MWVSNVRVTLHDHSSPEMLAGLREGRLQAALMMQPSKAAARGLVFERLRAYPIGIAVPPDHPFCRRRAVPMAELLTEPIVAYRREVYPDYHAMLARSLGANVKRIRLAEECDSGTSLITAVASGKGVVITASIITATAGKRLKFVPLVPPPTPAVVGIAYRTGKLAAPLQTFVDTARQLSSRSIEAR
jgi:DNA-binding transcriptional LysR family regulator